MPNSGAPSPPPSDDFEPWELEGVRAVVNTFFITQSTFREHERDDLLNEALQHWWLARSRYKGRRNASPRTYLGTVVRNKLRDLLESRVAQRRGGSRPVTSLDAPLNADDRYSETLASMIRGPNDTEAQAMDRELVAAVHAWKDLLPAEVRLLVEQLLRDPSLLAASRALGIPRTTLYRRLDKLKQLALDEGLQRFLD